MDPCFLQLCMMQIINSECKLFRLAISREFCEVNLCSYVRGRIEASDYFHQACHWNALLAILVFFFYSLVKYGDPLL